MRQGKDISSDLMIDHQQKEARSPHGSIASMITPIASPPNPASRMAAVVTEVLSPYVVVATLPFIVALSVPGMGFWGRVGLGVFVAGFSCLLPMVYIVVGARKNKWEGHHVRNRVGRARPLIALLASNAVGLAISITVGFPHRIIVLQIGMMLLLISASLVTVWWKISLHTSVLAASIGILAVFFTPWLLCGAPLVGVVAWSRVRLSDHTAAQTIAGAALGFALSGLAFLLY
jgi:hypothetical protein